MVSSTPFASLTTLRRSVLWGKPEPGEPNGFSAWSEGWVGSARYPCPAGVSTEDRVLLRYREYVRADAHDTMAVTETRQLELTTMGAGGR